MEKKEEENCLILRSTRYSSTCLKIYCSLYFHEGKNENLFPSIVNIFPYVENTISSMEYMSLHLQKNRKEMNSLIWKVAWFYMKVSSLYLCVHKNVNKKIAIHFLATNASMLAGDKFFPMFGIKIARICKYDG